MIKIIDCKLAKKITVVRSAGHPWTGRGPFDQVIVMDALGAGLSELKAKFKAKYWNVWFCSSLSANNMCDIIFYKPSNWSKEFLEDNKIRKQIARNEYSFYDVG